MTERELMQQALDALEPMRNERDDTALQRVIVALQARLAQPAQPPYSVQQAYAMAQVCLDLHEALGCKWGDNVYLTISQLKAAHGIKE